MPYWTYVLRSVKTNRHYVGSTDNLDARLLRHNAGMVFATAPYVPWELVYTEEHQTRSEAAKRERFFKSGKGREQIQELERNPPAAD